MPHFECGAFNHSATSPRVSACHGQTLDVAGMLSLPVPRYPEGLGLSVRRAR
jgi:hypothetical protein